MKKRFLTIFAILFATSNLLLMSQNQNAQDINITLPYLCGFEDTLEVSKWEINAGPDGPNCREYWKWGNRECSEGFNSLYVLSDTSLLTEIRAERVKPQLAISYRPFVIPSSFNPAKEYFNVDVSFEWKGSLDARESDFYGALNVYLLAEDYLKSSTMSAEDVLKSSSQSADLPSKLTNERVALKFLTGSVEWTNFLSERPTKIYPDKKYYLIFVWRSTNAWEKWVIPEAMCVDNIQITSSYCRKPTNLNVVGSCDTLSASWDGVGIEYYHFEYRPAGVLKWRGKTITKDKNVVIGGLKEGAYDVRVRGITGSDTSAWVTYNGAICYCPDRHCINFVQLDRPGVTCEIGEASNPTRGRPHIEPTLLGEYYAGPVDYGSNDKRSRHTIHWKQNEFDPRIGGQNLRTVPKDAMASMRLGNWEAGGQAEGVLFDYTVDTSSASILLLRYAVVLEAPGHGITQDPYFKLEILGEDGEPVSGRCGEFDFTPTNKNINWNRSGDYVWKDWTSIGVNLAPYHGKDIQIHLITQDCCMSKHFGYAYFTLDCSHAEITTQSCGSSPYMKMVAPEGFRYIWTRDDDRSNAISTERTLEVPISDAHTYYCNVEYLDVNGCGFEMHSAVFKREPVADFDYVIDLSECKCENKVVLTNKSCVYNSFAGEEDLVRTDEPCEEIYWTINDGEYEDATEQITYIMPKEGGELKVHLQAWISNGNCDDDSVYVIQVPPIYQGPDTLYKQLCKGETQFFGGAMHGKDTVVTEVLKNQYGCDSVTVLDLKFWPEPEDGHVYDTICDTGWSNFNGKMFKEPGVHTAFLQTENGCDSTAYLHLHVVPSVGVSISNEHRTICADESALKVEYNIVAGKPLPGKYSIIFDNFAHQNGFVDMHNLEFDVSGSTLDIPLPNPCRPNSYSATILAKDSSSICGDISIPVNFDVYYSSSILQPKFNNLITVLSEEANGGYEFEDEYKWYINGVQDTAVTESYYYLSENVIFGTECYYIVVKRKDDGYETRTCEICPGVNTPIDNIFEQDIWLQTTLLDRGQPIVIENFSYGKMNIFSFTGQLMNSVFIDSDYVEILAPQTSGIYLLQLQTENYSKVFKIKVK